VDWKQKEAAERRRGIAAVAQWAENAGKDTRDGFPEWCWDTGRTDDHAAAHDAWLTSPARIERWAERNGIFVGRGFAKWYLETGRIDTFTEAYEEYRALRAAEITEDRARRADA
jgi:hypothetical protein